MELFETYFFFFTFSSDRFFSFFFFICLTDILLGQHTLYYYVIYHVILKPKFIMPFFASHWLVFGNNADIKHRFSTVVRSDRRLNEYKKQKSEQTTKEQQTTKKLKTFLNKKCGIFLENFSKMRNIFVV